MKKMILFVAWLFSFSGIMVAEDLKITPQLPWQSVKSENGDACFSVKYPGTGWPSLTFSASVLPERHYLVTWQMKSSVTETNNPVQFSIDTGTAVNYSYPVKPGWSQYAVFFYSGKANNVKGRLYLNPGQVKEISAREFKLVEVTPEMFTTNLLPDGDFESGTGIPALWTKSYGTENYPASLVDNQDFLSGTRSLVMKFSPAVAKPEGITSIYLPVLPGQKFELSLWAKADAETGLNATAEVWSPVKHTGKHFYKSGAFKLSDNWKKFSVVVDVPDNLTDYPDLGGKIIRLNLSGVKSVGRTVTIDNITFRQIK